MKPPKIYWCVEAGTVFWLEADVLMFAPMNSDGTADLADGGEVETWEDCPVTEEHVRSRLA